MEEVAAGVTAVVCEGKNGGRLGLLGKATPTQRLLTLDPTQQESVAFGELDAQ